jgi:DNA polymerase-3 subunit alpha (Gram-positive type)
MNEMFFKKSLKKLYELYGENVDPQILSRFYTEKSCLESSPDIEFFDMLSFLRSKAKKSGEHMFVRGTYSSSFIAYLLGITEENPLPFHYYCKNCRRIELNNENAFPWDIPNKPCSCGEIMNPDGFNIPFDMHISNLKKPRANIVVSNRFLSTVKEIIFETMSARHKILYFADANDRMQIAFTEKGSDDNSETRIEEVGKYISVPYITVIPSRILDRVRSLEAKTGVLTENVPYKDEKAKEILLSGITADIPYVSNEKMVEAIRSNAPKNLFEFSKLFGAMHGTNTYVGYKKISKESNVAILDLPMYRDDLFFDLMKRMNYCGIVDIGLSLYLTELVCKGRAKENREFIEAILAYLGFPPFYINYVTNIKYMFHKAHSMTLIKYSLIFAWYKLNFPMEYKKIIKGLSDER